MAGKGGTPEIFGDPVFWKGGKRPASGEKVQNNDTESEAWYVGPKGKRRNMGPSKGCELGTCRGEKVD